MALELNEKQLKKWNETHKNIDNVDHKLCSECKGWIPSNTEHFYKNKANSIDGLHPYCKKCTVKRMMQWEKENPEKVVEQRRRFKERNPEKVKNHRRKSYLKNTEREKQRLKEWQRRNQEKLQEYRVKRFKNRYHDISDQEWYECLDYFKDSCAYCGISESEALLRDDQYLHKEHVEHDGANDITNCVPSCKRCNSSKGENSLNNWYNDGNPIYSKRRYNKIVKWILSFAE